MQLKTVLPHKRGATMRLSVDAGFDLTDWTVTGQIVSGTTREDFAITVSTPATLQTFEAVIDGAALETFPLGIAEFDFLYTKGAEVARGQTRFYDIQEGPTE